MIEPLKILIVDDEQEYRDTFRMILEAKGYTVGEASDGQQALEILNREYFPIVLSDVIMPGMGGLSLLNEIVSSYRERIEVIMVTGYGSVDSAVEAMRNGAFGYFIKTRNPDELMADIEKARKLLLLRTQNEYLRNNQAADRAILHSSSSRMQQIFATAEAVAGSRSNVLLLGESGVGKEVIAEMIHGRSARARMPFVAINCQFFSDSLMESELFGYEKGAFTGALGRRIGRFEEASGGTIFLDEIGEIALNTQVKLLRVLENRKIERIGSNKQIDVDFRLINATNRNLNQALRSGLFREDLFYRINTITLEIPPLRERREDIPDMIDFFVARYGTEMKKEIRGVEASTRRYLLSYDYPGNIRELKNMIERMVVLSPDGLLRLDALSLKQEPDAARAHPGKLLPYREARKEFEVRYIQDLMHSTANNITKAAEIMGISRRQLFNKITEYGLKEPQ